MMKLFKEVDNKLMVTNLEEPDVSKIEKGMWIHLTKPDTDLVNLVCEKTGLDASRLIDALDLEETAHIDFDGDNLLTFDTPVMKNGLFETVPFVIMSNDDYCVTMCSEETKLLELVLNKNKKIEPHKHNRLTLQLLYRISYMYINALRSLDKKKNELEERINSSTKNKEIFELMSLNKSLVYLSTSLNANRIVLAKLEKNEEVKMYEADYDLMDDAIIETNQAIEMCNIHRQILDGMLNAFASITSNNLNIVMQVLTVITLVLAIPTLIASIYGMNVVGLPFASVNHAFWIIMAFSIVLAVIGSILLVKYSSRTINQRKKK